MLPGRVVHSLSLALVLASAGWSPDLVAAQSTPAAIEPGCAGEPRSLSRAGCLLARQLLPSAAGAEVAVIELKSDRELPLPAALRERAREAVRSALGVRAAGERRKLRVELRLEVARGVLRIGAELRRGGGFWQRARAARADVERRGFAEVPLDAELRALVPPPPLVVSRVLRLPAPERGIVALACGALAADGGQELALVSRSRVRVGRVVRGAFAERAAVSWSELSVVAPVPLREPIASAEITPDGKLRVGITDRRDGVELNAELGVVARFDGRVPVPGGGCASRSGLGLSGRIEACRPGERAPRPLGAVLDAVAGTSAVDDRLGRELASGALMRAGQPLRTTTPAGAQLALGDADGDGTVELAYSADAVDGSRDRLSLVSLEGNAATPRFELDVPSIGAIGICAKPEGPGMAPIAVASGAELWLIQ